MPERRQEGIQHMDIGFIGLGNMGQPMARRLIAAGHKLIVYDTRNDAVAPLVALGAQLASSPADVADRVETVMASLPSLQISEKVALGEGGVIQGKRIKRFIDLSTTGATVAAKIAAVLAKKNIVQIDCPVSGGVGGATKGTLAVMVSGPKAEIDLVKDVLAVFGKVFVIGEKPGMAQTMKLANNFLSATAMAATSEAVAMGVKAGLDPTVMIDVINAGSGRTTASDGKFPQAILPRTFNYGFATALMLKDVRLCVEQAKSLNVPNSVMSAVLDQWETTNKEFGGDSDFTAIVKMIEQRAGVIVGKKT
ncbi:MAG TPA: NAD(P)-dependent oxidoreductase [Pseudolabrys sp.]